MCFICMVVNVLDDWSKVRIRSNADVFQRTVANFEKWRCVLVASSLCHLARDLTIFFKEASQYAT